jgi:hypothetical protein
MKRFFTISLAAVLLAAPAHAAEIEVTEPADIALAAAISDAVDTTTDKIGACIGNGGAHQDCLCAGKAEIAGLFVADMGDGQSLTLFLDTVAASSAPPDCG